MRNVVLALGAVASVAFSLPAQAQGKPLPPPATDAMPPVEVRIELADGKASCAPAELALPADTNVELRVVSTADRPVTLTMAGQFENGRVLHADGDLFHVASEKGYLVKANGRGSLRLRSLPAGEVAYGCTSTANQSAPFQGRVVLTKHAG